MTALSEYQRLEATGLWHASPEAQRRDVIVSVGDATLVITDSRDTALAHWSLPAVRRLNPGERPALLAPGRDSEEVLEIDDEDMIAAINRIQRAIARRRPQPGRLRQIIYGVLGLALVGLAVFWLPGALTRHTVSVVPEPTRAAVGQRLLARLDRISDGACDDASGRAAMGRLGRRVLGPGSGQVVVLKSGVNPATHLPGGIILLNRALIEDFEDPDVAAGFLLAETLRADRIDPMMPLLQHGGILATLRLLTTGNLTDAQLDSYAEALLTAAPAPLPDEALLARFAAAGIRATPYAFAVDISGETTLGLIEADPVAVDRARPLLGDGAWVALQGICGE